MLYNNGIGAQYTYCSTHTKVSIVAIDALKAAAVRYFRVSRAHPQHEQH